MKNNVTGKIVRKVLGSIIFLFLSLLAHATHEVGGYISYTCLGGNNIQVTIYDYTNTWLTTADRDTMRIYWGDGQSTLAYRLNGPTGINGDPTPNGEPICNYNFDIKPAVPLTDARKLNIYQATHNYTGPGNYNVWMDDPDRMAGISNIPGSVSVDYYMHTVICQYAFLAPGCVNSPLITNPPVCQYGCARVCYTYNPGAYIPTPPSDVNDSIIYSLGSSLQLNQGTLKAEICSGYSNQGATVDPHTGTLTWCPAEAGKWNFVILMTTMRRTYNIYGNDTQKVFEPLDTVELELEVIINSNCEFNPSVTSKDTCIVADSDVYIKYKAFDSQSEPITITDAGEPFSLSPPATLSNYSPAANPIYPILRWQTNCPEVRANPYEVVIRATEKYPVPGSGIPPDTNYFSAYGISMITVIGPAPNPLTATVEGTTVCLTWAKSPCPQAIGYHIYRQKGCSSWKHGYCETGVPAYTGYTLLATLNGIDDTTYCDSNAGAGLSPGVQYSYIVDAFYPLEAASQSYATNDTCVLINLDVPIITNVSVSKTDPSNGEVFVKWIKPIADAADLDTSAFRAPYKYVLERATGMNNTSFTPIATYTSAVFKTNSIDTNFMDIGLNTVQNSYNYKIEFYSNSKLVGSSGSASSIYLALQRGDQNMRLGWSSVVPWTDTVFNIYRSTAGSTGPYTFLAKTAGTSYMDTGLHNGSQYCYYVESTSLYVAAPKIPHPLFDSSETVCGVPEDTIAPCSPPLTIKAKCVLYEDSVIWSNPDRICPRANKVVSYQVWYTPVEGGDMAPIATFNSPIDTVFVNSNLTSVAGCYAVYAFDSAGQASPLNTVCVDNCPLYALPNVFTPNSDGNNDLFIPLEPYRYVKSIDINIYNRWGQLMFHTTDPQINWNGTVDNTGGKCPDGVYYYVCVVNEIRLTGIVPVTLKGFIQLIR